MVPRYTTNGDGAAVQDPGRVNSERIIERGNTKKWLEAMKADADKEVAFALRKLKLANENAVNRSKEIDEEAMTAIEGALAVVNLQRELLKGAKGGLERSMSAQQMGSRIAAENREAKEYLTGEKIKALKVRKGTTTAGKARAERSALEMAKGTFKQ